MKENKNEKVNEYERAPGFRPRLAFYHANPKGTGCAIQMSLHPAHDYEDGGIYMRLANQATVGNPMGPNPTFPRFDWENAISVKLDFNDLSRFLQVMRGECESIEGDRGLWHRTAKGSTNITFRHLVDPVSGYVLTVNFKSADGEEARAQTLLSPAEALGLCEAFSASMIYVAFGVPNAPME